MVAFSSMRGVVAIVLALVLVGALAGPALAQDDPTGAPPPGSGGGGVVGTDGTRTFGIGVEQTLGGIGSATFVYDAGRWHIDALLGFSTIDVDAGDDVRRVMFAGRFFWVIHTAERADLGLGGGLGVVDTRVGDESQNNLHVEVAAQIRAFLVPSVALTASIGLVLVTGDDPAGTGDSDSLTAFGAQLGGAFGLTYFF